MLHKFRIALAVALVALAAVSAADSASAARNLPAPPEGRIFEVLLPYIEQESLSYGP